MKFDSFDRERVVGSMEEMLKDCKQNNNGGEEPPYLKCNKRIVKINKNSNVILSKKQIFLPFTRYLCHLRKTY